MIPMSPGEVCDRYTILRMKAKRLELKEYYADERRFHKEILAMLCDAEEQRIIPAFLDRVLTLMEINAKIWVQEAAMRAEFPDDPCSKEDIDLAERGRRSLLIRDLNKLRVDAKADLDKMFGVVPDVKVDHASTGEKP